MTGPEDLDVDITVRVEPPPITETVERIRLQCGTSYVYLHRWGYPSDGDAVWSVSPNAGIREEPGYPQGVTQLVAMSWAKRRIRHLATQAVARQRAVDAAATVWPDPLKQP